MIEKKRFYISGMLYHYRVVLPKVKSLADLDWEHHEWVAHTLVGVRPSCIWREDTSQDGQWKTTYFRYFRRYEDAFNFTMRFRDGCA